MIDCRSAIGCCQPAEAYERAATEWRRLWHLFTLYYCTVVPFSDGRMVKWYSGDIPHKQIIALRLSLFTRRLLGTFSQLWTWTRCKVTAMECDTSCGWSVISTLRQRSLTAGSVLFIHHRRLRLYSQIAILQYIDSNIFSLPDSTFAAFLRGSCVLQIALIIIIIIYLYVVGGITMWKSVKHSLFVNNFETVTVVCKEFLSWLWYFCILDVWRIFVFVYYVNAYVNEYTVACNEWNSVARNTTRRRMFCFLCFN